MLLISHRGNIDGPNPETENSVKQILEALDIGFQVEIDVRYSSGKWYLGHDYAQYQVDPHFLKYNSDRLWCHAKNIDAMTGMLDLGIHCFWHQSDYYTLTSSGIVWAYPNYYCKGAILVMPSKEFLDTLTEPIYGICVDDPMNYL